MYSTKYIIFTLFLILASGCKDLYEPAIEAPAQRLVVEGLITNRPGPHLVKLSLSGTFGESFLRMVERGALVEIIDSRGKIIQLTEQEPGLYFTPVNFRGETGNAYTLQIKTADGRRYQTLPQPLLPSGDVTGVGYNYGRKLFYTILGASRNLLEFNIGGNYVFLQVNSDGSNSRFRFASSLLQDYTVAVGPVDSDYCWLIRPVTDYLESEVSNNNFTNISQDHQIGFVPAMNKDLIHIGFPDYVTGPPNISYGPTRIIMNYLYTLNEDAYAFHDFRSSQLNDEGRFFDPIAAQIPGNVFNPDDPDDIVFGLFEVSSVLYTPVQLTMFRDSTVVRMVNLSDTMPVQGCVRNELPRFLTEMELSKGIENNNPKP
jgi:hypothetical protein